MRIRGRNPGAFYAVMLAAAASCLGRTTTNGSGPADAGGTSGSHGATSGVAGTSAAGGSAADGSGGSLAGGGAAALGGSAADASTGCPWSQCIMRWCNNAVLQCGDCFDNDGDGLLDSEDPDCLGPCDNSEADWRPWESGSGVACPEDCYFDWDYDWVNDQCFWSYVCDPLAIPPDYPPKGNQGCGYDPDAALATCAELIVEQSAMCLTTCGPLLPNGCDCFGCCAVPQAPSPIWLGLDAEIPCSLARASDAKVCPPCTIVPSCFNPCDTCEICLGKTSLPPECGSLQQCPPGAQRCGLPDQPCCPENTYCITGCCQPVPPKQP
jgi:hypothetical protein